MRVVWKKLLRLFNRRKIEAELDEEMAFHFNMEVEKLISRGLSPKEAKHRAKIEFGGIEKTREECRDAWRIRIFESAIRHFRLAGRQMMKRKGFTFVVVATLALGIGINTAIYSLANGVILQPLSYADANRLVHLTEQTWQGDERSVSYPNFKDWKDRQTSFSKLGVIRKMGGDFIDANGATRINTAVVSHEFLEALQIEPVLGILFDEETDRLGANPTALISENFWRNHYGSDRSIIGESINVSGKSYQVIGVVPSIFPYEERDVWTPLGLVENQSTYTKRDDHMGLRAIGRLKPGVSLQQAEIEIKGIAAQLEEEYPKTNTGLTAVAEGLKDRFIKNDKPAVYSLLAASCCLLLITCANIANMQLARSQSRNHEFGIRVSVGANRLQVLSQLLVENLTLGLISGAAGILVAYQLIEGLNFLLADKLPRMINVGIDSAALLYVTLISILASLFFGLAPMRQVLRSSRKGAINADSRSSDSKQGQRWKSTLIVTEVTLACVLLICTGMMIRTTANLYSSNPGFETDQRLTFAWSFSGEKYRDRNTRIQTVERALEKIRTLPNVIEAAAVFPMPLSGNGNGTVYFVEGDDPTDDSRRLSTERVRITNTYFDAMGMEIIKGRNFNQFDTFDSKRVVIVDRKFVEKNFPDEDPIGKRFAGGRAPPSNPKFWMEIIGVVEHVKHRGVSTDTREQMYLPITQNTPGGYSFVLEIRGDPMALSSSVQEILRKVEPNSPIRDIQTFNTLFNDSVSRERLLTNFLSVLSSLAVVLSVVGIFGVLSFTVGQRTDEFGIRMAIGATPQVIQSLVLAHGFKMIVIGLALGVAVAMTISRLIQGMLFGVSIYDPISILIVIMTLGLAGILSCWLPAYRATRIAPAIALRGE